MDKSFDLPADVNNPEISFQASGGTKDNSGGCRKDPAIIENYISRICDEICRFVTDSDGAPVPSYYSEIPDACEKCPLVLFRKYLEV